MENIIQEIETRIITGKKVKVLRRAGITPANIYGPGIESQAVQANSADLEKTLSKSGYTQLITLKRPADKDRQVLVKDLQRDILTGQLLHVDFHQVSLTEKVKVSVPIIFKGEARASRRNDLNVLDHLNSIEVECLPTEIPESVTIDISKLAEAGDRLFVSDLIVVEKISILTRADEILVSVSQARIEEKIEEVEKEAVTEEVVTAKAEEPTETTPEEPDKKKPG